MLSFDRVAEIAQKVETSTEREAGGPSWAGSPFDSIRRRAPRQKGAIGSRLVREIVEASGYTCKDAGRGADFEVGDDRVEVRTSLRWTDGNFSFAQVRDESYDQLAMLALEPFRVRLWVVPKETALEKFPNQHGTETHWLVFDADEPPGWLKPYLWLEAE
jgi:hypothetical protein